MVDYSKRVIKGSGIVFIFLMISYFFAYLVRLLYARNLTPEEYGLFYAVLGVVNFFLIFRDLGLSETLVKFIPEFEVNKENDKIKSSIVFVALIQFFMALIIVSVLWLISDYLTNNYFKNPIASMMLKLISLGFLVEGFVEVMTLSLRAFQRPLYFALIDSSKTIIIFILSLILFQFNKNVLTPSIAYLIFPFFLLIILSVLFLKTFNIFKYKLKIERKLAKTLLTYSFQILLGTGAGIIFGYLNTILLTYFSGVVAVGIFNIALPTASLLLIFSKPIAIVLFPLTSELWTKNNRMKIKKITELIYTYLFVLIVPFTLAVVVFPKIILRILFGEKYLFSVNSVFSISYNEAVLALQVLIIGILFYTLASINFAVIAGIGKPKERTKSVYIAAFVNLIIAVILVPKFGILGAVVATTVGNISLLIVSGMIVKRSVDLKLPLKNWLNIFSSGLVFLFILSLLKNILDMNVWLEMFISLSVSGLIYLILMFVLKIITKKKIRYIFKLMNIKIRIIERFIG